MIASLLNYNHTTLRIARSVSQLVIVIMVVITSSSFALAAASPSQLSALTFTMFGDNSRTRIVVAFDKEPDIHTFFLTNPYRMVVDLPETRFGFEDNKITPRGLVSRVRYGLSGQGRSRLIFTATGPFETENIQVAKNEDDSGYRLLIDMVSSSADKFEAAREEARKISTQSDASQAGIDTANPIQNDQVFKVMLDAGHGGIDSGAESPSGLKEKDITLAFAKELREQLSKLNGIEVLMTRDDDTFLRLSERVNLARKQDADLFISIHADTINQSDIRGATVYTISDKASDAVAKAMADRENKSDAVAGIVTVDQPEVADILLDLTRRETHTFSLSFADKVIASLRGEVNLITNPHRFAGFQVLRAPDVPSVLIEIGYLSNSDDEKLINSPEWRNKMAERLASAINEFKELKRPNSVTKQ